MKYFNYKMYKAKSKKGKLLVKIITPLIIINRTCFGIINCFDYILLKTTRLIYWMFAITYQLPLLIITNSIYLICIPVYKLLAEYEKQSEDK